MAPAKPPLPVPSSLPFQLDPAGIHTSIAIRESADGVATAAIRQNAGTVSGRVVPGGVNGPAGTSSAAVTVASGSVSAASPAQLVAAWRSARTAPRTADVARSRLI